MVIEDDYLVGKSISGQTGHYTSIHHYAGELMCMSYVAGGPVAAPKSAIVTDYFVYSKITILRGKCAS